jgi:hypothetical protein
MVTADPGNYLFFVWGSIGVWTQCFTLLKKALLLLEPCLFALLILEIVSQFLHRMAWLTILLFKLPTVPEMTSVATMSSFFKWRWGSPKFFFFFLPQVGLELWSFGSQPTKQLGMTGICHPCPAIGWDGILQTLCLGWPWTMILPMSASQVARIMWATGVWHQEIIFKLKVAKVSLK